MPAMSTAMQLQLSDSEASRYLVYLPVPSLRTLECSRRVTGMFLFFASSYSASVLGPMSDSAETFSRCFMMLPISGILPAISVFIISAAASRHSVAAFSFLYSKMT